MNCIVPGRQEPQKELVKVSSSEVATLQIITVKGRLFLAYSQRPMSKITASIILVERTIFYAYLLRFLHNLKVKNDIISTN